MSETVKTLLKNGTVVSGDMSVIEDVLIDGEKIVKVGRNLEAEDAQVVDVNGKLLFPGFIDGHTHFDLEVAGTVTADDFETGTRAAIAGGTTLVIDYASQDKGGHTLREGLEKWHEKADGKCSCDYSFHMSIVEWNEETQREIQDMINEGITSFKLYMTYPAATGPSHRPARIVHTLPTEIRYAPRSMTRTRVSTRCMAIRRAMNTNVFTFQYCFFCIIKTPP